MQGTESRSRNRPQAARAARWLLVILLGCVGSQLTAQTIYKWVDERGRTQYTQTKPPPGARLLDQSELPSEPDAAHRERCEAIRLAALKLAQLKRGGVELSQVVDAARQIQVKDDGLKQQDWEEIARYVYGSSNAQRRDVVEISERAHKACLAAPDARLPDDDLAAATEIVPPAAPRRPVRTDLRYGLGWVSNGLIITHYDLVADALRVRVEFVDGRESPAFKNILDPLSGIALLRVGGDLPPGLPIARREAAVNSDVFALRFDQEGFRQSAASPMTGKITALSGWRGDPNRYRYSFVMSTDQLGAPLINPLGEVVGLTIGESIGGPDSGNSGYAVKSPLLHKALSEAATGIANRKPARGSLQALTERVGSAMVRITVEQPVLDSRPGS